MRIKLDHHSGEAIYRQIVEQVKYQIACGRLIDGEKLPSIRSLANELKINPRTVVKAYEELKASGQCVMRQGQGVFVSCSSDSSKKERDKVITELSQRLLAESYRVGATKEEVLEIINKVAQEMERKDS